jgi:zinc-ribbon domain
MSAGYAARFMQERSRRDTLLLAGGATLAGAAVLVLIEAIVSLADELQGFDPAAYKVASGTDLLAACLILASFSVLVPAFLAKARSRRATLLGTSLALFGAAASATLISDLLRAIEDAVQHGPGTYVAAAAVAAVADAAVLTAAVIASLAFFSSRSPAEAGRDGKLGLAASAFAASLLFSTVSGILRIIAYSGNYLPSGITSGLGVEVAGDAVEIAAAVLVAVAFFRSQQRRDRAQAWLTPRDGLLAVASAVLVLAFLLTGIGQMVYAGALSSAGFSSSQSVAGAWLGGVASLVELAAAVCVSIGFFLSHRAQGLAGTRTANTPTMPQPAVSTEAGTETISFCSNCGAARPAGARFCASCGHEF